MKSVRRTALFADYLLPWVMHFSRKVEFSCTGTALPHPGYPDQKHSSALYEERPTENAEEDENDD